MFKNEFLRTKRVISFVLALTIVLSTVVPICKLEVSASTGDPYYEEYGITYEQLFTLYPQYLSSDVENQAIANVIDTYTHVLDSHSDASNFIASYIYSLRNDAGFSVLFSEIMAGLNLGKSTEEKLMVDTVTLLLENISNVESVVYDVASEVENSFSTFKEVYDFTNSKAVEVFTTDLKKACKWTSNDEIDAILEKLFSDEVSKKLDGINTKIERCNVIISFFALFEIQTGLIETIKENIREDSGLHEAIDLFMKKRSDPVCFVATYCNEAVLEFVEEALLEALNTRWSVVGAALEVLSFASNILYQGPDAADVYRAIALGGYVNGLGYAVLSKRNEFGQAKINGTLVGADDIDEYKLLYIAHIESIRTTLENTMPLANTQWQGLVQQSIDICDKLTYDDYINRCMAKLKADIDAGIIAPPGGIAGDIAACVKEVYPSYGTIVITKKNANIMDRPCSVNTDATSQLIESGALNAEYIVTGLYLNTADNYWYQITTKNGKTGYIYSGNCAHSAYLSDISVAGLDVPTQIDVGSRYFIKGTISTVYTNLTNISFQVYDENGNRKTGGSVDVSGKSYVLDNSAIDIAAEFNILEAGTYHCVLEATVDNYSATECYREKVLLHTNKLVVGNIDSSGDSYPASTVIDLANQYVGSNFMVNYCLGFIATLFNQAYGFDGNVYSSCCAYANGSRYISSTSRSDIPLGACVYFGGSDVYCSYCGNYAGHIGIHVGNNNIVHAWAGNIVCTSIDYVVSCGYPYRGYGWYAYTELSNQASCNHQYTPTEEAATCEKDGVRSYTCSKCGDSYTESIPALGHDYQGVETAPTCSSMGFVTYTCSRCGDSYTENSEESWSEWSDIYPEGISAGLIQSKMEYRYRDKETTTGTSDEMPGWTLIGPTTIYGDYGAWSTWSDTPVSASDETKVETRTVWPYYYFLCGNCGAHMHGYGSCYTWAGGCGAATYESGWREIWSTTSWNNAGLGDWYGTGKYYAYVDGQLVFQLSGVSAKTQYRYCTREIIDGYSFYRWGEWSEWGDTVYTATDDRNVESRSVYRYYTGPLGEHDWDDGVVTVEPTCVNEGEKTHTCMICAEVETRPIPTSDHHYTSEVIGATCTEYSYVRYTCIDCGYSYEVHADEDYSEWSENYPEGVDEELIESKTEYRYSDYETITSYEPELDGYELIGSEWQESASGTITYASSWPAGFSTNHSLYAAYNHSPKVASETATDKTVINGDSHAGYIYWHWCRGSYTGGPINRTISDQYTSVYTTFHAFYTTSSGSEFDPSGIYGYGAHYYSNGSCCSDSYWYYPISVRTQDYTTYRNLFTYGRWSEWSEWSETEYKENASRKVETQTLYRYLTAPSGVHSWDEGTITKEPTENTEGERTYTCTACGAIRTESIPVTGHEHRYEAVVTAPTCTERGYTTYTCKCGESYIADYVDALGHSFGNWIVIQGPTATEDGLEERSCARCGHTEQRSIAKQDNPFNDVDPGSFYYEPVMWAIEKGITNGTSATTFSPNDQCMRAHVVTFLWRAAGSPEPKLMVNPFVDVKPSDFYYKPVLWALENGITSGMDATHFGPTSYCNRAQVVTFLYRTMGSPELESAENPFTDVAAGSFYEKPVLWAVKNGITNGLSATTFGPSAICNRAQIVTFLYRAFT